MTGGITRTSLPCIAAALRAVIGEVFAALTAQQSRLWPNRTVSQAVYLYIAALRATVLNCRSDEGTLRLPLGDYSRISCCASGAVTSRMAAARAASLPAVAWVIAVLRPCIHRRAEF